MRKLLLALILVLTVSSGFAATGGTGQNLSEAVNDSSCMVFFYSDSCPHCQTVEDYISENEHGYDIRKHQASGSTELFSKYVNAYDVPQKMAGAVPTAFIGDNYAVGSKPIIQLMQENQNASSIPCPEIVEEESEKEKTGEKLSILGVTGLALADAVNPCALAVLIILMTSILSRFPERRRKALTTGLSFTASILIAYFSMGMLLIFGFKSVTSITSLQSSWLTQGIGVLAILIGIFNLKDYISHGSLGFVMEVPISWRPRMKKFIKSVTSPAGAFLVGLLVSLFLLPCTSGPYFVAGGLLSDLAWSNAAVWLLFYNAVFVLPMLALTLMVYTGYTTVERISEWRQENIERLHLVAGVVLVLIGIAMISGIL